MVAKPIQAFRNTKFVRFIGIAGAVLAVFVANAPLLAQQVHGTGTGSSRGKAQPISAPYSQNQMTNMLDQIETGKSPNLPAHSGHQMHQSQAHSVSSMGHTSAMGRGTYPGTVRTSTPNMMGHGMGMGSMGHGMGMGAMGHGMGMGAMGHGMGMGAMGHGMGMGAMGHGMGMGAMGHGMGMGAMGHGMGMGAMGHGMGTMGGGAGAGMTGGGATQFMQQLKQKLSSMQPQEGAGGESAGSAAGGGGMQAQLMQHLFQGQSAPGAMGGAPTGQFGMPTSRPSRGMGMGMAPMTQPKAPMQQFSLDSIIKRPPGISGITGGAPISSPTRGAPATSTASDLERQMEQQYGH